MKQSKEERNCGQRCLAYILNITLKESVALVGHNKGTKSKELTKYIGDPKNVHGDPSYDALCILRWKRTGNWHWVVQRGDDIWDPVHGYPFNKQRYFERYPDLRITSHFKLPEGTFSHHVGPWLKKV